MNKFFAFALAAATVAVAFAQDEVPDLNIQDVQPQKAARNDDTPVWPAFFAISQWPRSADVIGLRLTIPFSTSQENVTGLDVGFWGRSLYFEGVQLNVLRSDVVDSMAGFQAGIYNSIGRGDLLGVQVGLWNESMSLRGVQVGLVNVIGDGAGLQVGLINRAETMHGYQIGVINVIRDAELQFMPVLNIGF